MTQLSGTAGLTLPNVNSAVLIAELAYQNSKEEQNRVAGKGLMRTYQAPQVASGAFNSTGAFLAYEAARLRHEKQHGKDKKDE